MSKYFVDKKYFFLSFLTLFSHILNFSLCLSLLQSSICSVIHVFVYLSICLSVCLSVWHQPVPCIFLSLTFLFPSSVFVPFPQSFRFLYLSASIFLWFLVVHAFVHPSFFLPSIHCPFSPLQYNSHVCSCASTMEKNLLRSLHWRWISHYVWDSTLASCSNAVQKSCWTPWNI